MRCLFECCAGLLGPDWLYSMLLLLPACQKYSVLCEVSADDLQRPTGSTRNELFSVLGYTQSNQFCFVRVYARVKHARRVPGVFFTFSSHSSSGHVTCIHAFTSCCWRGLDSSWAFFSLLSLLSLLKASHTLGHHGATSSDRTWLGERIQTDPKREYCSPQV